VPRKPTDTATFLEATQDARRVMVLDLGFLGDSIHLLPALWAVRLGYPHAELHTMVSEHVTGIMKVAPWINQVWGYPRFPKGPKWYQDFGRVKKLRAAEFDVVINLNGSDRSSLLTRLSGARWRLGRKPQGEVKWFWKHLFTHVVECPYGTMPVSTQRWQCLKQVGFPGDAPEFNIQVPPLVDRTAREKAGGQSGWIHVSPFTTEDYKELPIPQLAQLVNTLHEKFPQRPVILSCAGNDRERMKMDELLRRLAFSPARVFPGTLNLLELAAVIQRSAVHLGGDSGALHVAWMTGARTVSWFRRYDSMADWQPVGPKHRSVIGEASPEGLQGMNVDALVGGAIELLKLADAPAA
jgi:ADP-heptose:LPS heptosyltransferase